MSDALTDIANDERRGRLFDKYLDAVCRFVDYPTDENLKNAAEAAVSLDSFRSRGYWSGHTSVSASITDALKKLKDGDRGIWARLLSQAWDRVAFRQLKKLSPYRDNVVMFVDYGCGFATIRGELEQLAGQLIKNKGFKTYDCDKYFVALPGVSNSDDVGVEWLYCGIYGVNGPRESK